MVEEGGSVCCGEEVAGGVAGVGVWVDYEGVGGC